MAEPVTEAADGREELNAAVNQMTEILNTSRLSMAEVIIVLTSVSIKVLDMRMEVAHKVGEDSFVRIIRKSLHALPDGLTQFLHAWQPGRSKEAMKTASKVIKETFDKAEKEVNDSAVARRIIHRRL